MHEWFCGPTAFHCLRTPPQVKSLYPLFPDIGFPAGRRQVKHDYDGSTGWANVLGPLPLHAIVRDPSLRRPSLVVKPRVWTGDLPAGAFYDDEDLGITYASPAFTVFTMASQLSITQMIMAMYELTGSWSIYRPNREIQIQIDHMENTRLAWVGGWQQVRTTRGLATSLWKRGPLITTHELLAFARGISGMRNAQKYLRAAARVQGNTASPLEARLSMLLSLPPREGGEGFPPFFANYRIAYSHTAATLAGKHTCYADIFFPATETHPAIDVECHGHSVHDGDAQGGVDANRSLALQHMGIEVIHVTHEQLTDIDRFEAFCDHLAARLRFKRRSKTEAMLNRRDTLRSELFGSWETLGGGLAVT
ncbi:hypothetical protein E4J93_07235 [Collinsella sp. BA40]|uniref:hypothetical protein n=1 Tax=Collinsella sp. BA40 TaxID=2560852 RepID=UPI0011C87FDF|nr:hypothetical protein [Collinsella sp. BA40]TXF35132.1 hypothetical protein E4J93_07235 [Collinsella sp. BA40]